MKFLRNISLWIAERTGTLTDGSRWKWVCDGDGWGIWGPTDWEIRPTTGWRFAGREGVKKETSYLNCINKLLRPAGGANNNCGAVMMTKEIEGALTETAGYSGQAMASGGRRTLVTTRPTASSAGRQWFCR